jgi:hypothetical protein
LFFDIVKAASHIRGKSGQHRRVRWYHLSLKFPARIRFESLYRDWGGFKVRLDGHGWMADVFIHDLATTVIIRQTRGNRDRMLEDLLATRLSM